MWSVLYGDATIADARDPQLPMTDKSLEVALNRTGTFKFTLPSKNPFCGKIGLLRKDLEVTVRQDGEELFRGRATRATERFDGSVEYECEGDRGYLNDAVLPPYATGEDGVPDAVEQFFNWLVARYNDSMPKNARFVVGLNQGRELDPSGSVSRESSSWSKVWDEMREAIVDGLGGYVRTRTVRGVRYIDLLASGDKASRQRIRFGENLLDFARNLGGEDFCTRCFAVGGTPEGAEGDVTLEGLDDRRLFDGYELVGGWVVDIEAERERGVIEGVFEDRDETDPEALLAKALRWLVNVKVGDSIEMSAIDLHNVDPTVAPIRIGDYVRATSEPHGFDEWFICTSRIYDLDDPGGDRFTLGNEYDTLTGTQSKRIAQLNADVSRQVGEVERVALDGAVLVITSTRGLLFKNGSESTVLQCAVFPIGGERLDTMSAVRERFGEGAYIEWKWMHEGTGEWGTLLSSDPHIAQDGMWLSVSPDDVATKTTFSASLITP